MKINVAVPSYKRATTFRDKTAKLLERYNVPPEWVTVFVANEEEKEKYAEALKDSPYKNIVVGIVGMGAIRNFIREYYDEGEFIVNLDDDLSDIKKKDPNDEKKFADVDDIVKEAEKLITDNEEYKVMSKAINPYGDGFASERIANALLHYFGFIDKRPDDFDIEKSMNKSIKVKK